MLNDISDSKFTFIHAKVKCLSLLDINLKKAKIFGYSDDSIQGWLKAKYPVPLILLKNPSAMAYRIDYLCMRASNSKVMVPKLDSKLAYFLGVVFGDGHIAGFIRKKGYRQFRIVIQKKRTNFSEFILPPLIETLFGVKPKLFFWKRKSELITISINSKVVSRLFTNLFRFSYGKKSDKTIDFIQGLPVELQRHFVAGLFDTDGGRSAGSFSFCNSSKKTALFVKSFLEKQKIKTRFYSQAKGACKWYQVRVPKIDKIKFLGVLPLKKRK